MAHERIEINPKVMGGKPVIRGTRVPVELVLRKLGAGASPEAIIADHPRLTPADIHAAQAFAADYLADEELILPDAAACAGLRTNASRRGWSLCFGRRTMT